jgi:hypothetical protein
MMLKNFKLFLFSCILEKFLGNFHDSWVVWFHAYVNWWFYYDNYVPKIVKIFCNKIKINILGQTNDYEFGICCFSK